MSLTDNGVKVDWRSLDSLSALIYSDSQRAIAGAASIEIDKADTTSLLIEYAGYQPQYDGLARLIIRCLYKGAEKTFDAPVCDFVSTTAEATGITVIDDPELDVHITVTEVSTSILDAAIAAAFDGAEKANSAAQQAKDEADKLPGIAADLQNAIDTAEATNSEIKSNESERDMQEQTRQQQEAQRQQHEAQRQQHEEARETKEAERQQATENALREISSKESEILAAEEQRIIKERERQENEEQRISTFNTFQSKIDSKQDTISDLDSIREGARKGATALQSYTETDPVYMADKPNLALKSEIPDISGKADKTTIVTETEGNASYAILPNVLTKLGTLASSVTLSLDTSKEESGVTNVYDIIFVTPADAPSITWPEGISWIGGSAPAIAGGKTYEVSIMDNLATYGEF